jgi:hypothetical protein
MHTHLYSHCRPQRPGRCAWDRARAHAGLDAVCPVWGSIPCMMHRGRTHTQRTENTLAKHTNSSGDAAVNALAPTAAADVAVVEGVGAVTACVRTHTGITPQTPYTRPPPTPVHPYVDKVVSLRRRFCRVAARRRQLQTPRMGVCVLIQSFMHKHTDARTLHPLTHTRSCSPWTRTRRAARHRSRRTAARSR